MEFVMKSDEELDVLRDKYYSELTRKGYTMIDGFTLPASYKKFEREIVKFEVFDDDVWVTSTPKCGTTWTQEMVWCICNNLDFEVDLDYRFPFLEFYCMYDLDEYVGEGIPYVLDSFNFTKTAKRPRFIKTHLPWNLLPKQIRNFERRPRIIHVARNLKDACVSHFYHSKFLKQYTGDFQTHWQLYIRDKLTFAPYRENVLSYWQKRHESNVHFIRYEDLKTNLPSAIKQTANFLNVQLNQSQIEQLLQHLSFEEMKKNRAVDHSILAEFLDKNNLIFDKTGAFIRCGQLGSHEKQMGPEVVAIFNKWLAEMNVWGLNL